MRDRIELCKYYQCKGERTKGREADHNGYCQKCGKYEPRVRRRHLNKKKQELEKIRKNEKYQAILTIRLGGAKMTDYEISYIGDRSVENVHHIGISHDGNYYSVIFGEYENG